MADDLNQLASSQPGNAPGPNGADKPAEAGGDPMARMKSWEAENNNKSQQLAAERRAFEEERARWHAERGGINHHGGQGPQNQGQPYQGQGWQQPGQWFGQGGAQPQPQPQLWLPPNYPDLVREFGAEAANQMVMSQNQGMQLVSQHLMAGEQRLAATEARLILNEIHSRGKEKYGEKWNEKSKEVIDYIGKTGQDLDYAWWKINGGSFDSVKQEAINQAYQNQQSKNNAQVANQNFQPSPNAAPEIKSVSDAFKAALQEHGGY